MAPEAPLLEELDRAGERARDLSASPRGRLRVATSAAFARAQLAGWLPDFQARYPDLEVELLLDSRYADLVSDRIDVALRVGRVDLPSVVALRLCAAPRALVASLALLRGRRLDPADVAREPCLLFPHEGSAPLWRFRDGAGVISEHVPRTKVVAPEGGVLIALALRGQGLTLLLRWLCAEELRSGALQDAFPEHEVTATDFDTALSLVYASRSYVPLKVRAFVDHVRALFRGGPPWDDHQRGGRRSAAMSSRQTRKR